MKQLLGTPPVAGYNLSKLLEEARAAMPACLAINEINSGAQLAAYLPDGDPATVGTWQAVLDAHDKTLLSVAQQEANQTASAQNSLKPLLVGLAQLSSEDAAYALMGRVMARKDGKPQAEIDGIVDRASAVNYLTTKTEWVNLTAAAKAWLADQLDMHAVIYQILLITLRR